MKLGGFARLLGLTAQALLALVAALLYAPAARAECGDYVHFVPHPGRPTADSRPLPAPANEPGPCHGPFCSRGQVPTPPPTPFSPLQQDHWACLGDLRPPPPQAPVAHLPGDPLPGRASHSPGVYHPPRPSRAS